MLFSLLLFLTKIVACLGFVKMFNVAITTVLVLVASTEGPIWKKQMCGKD